MTDTKSDANTIRLWVREKLNSGDVGDAIAAYTTPDGFALLERSLVDLEQLYVRISKGNGKFRPVITPVKNLKPSQLARVRKPDDLRTEIPISRILKKLNPFSYARIYTIDNDVFNLDPDNLKVFSRPERNTHASSKPRSLKPLRVKSRSTQRGRVELLVPIDAKILVASMSDEELSDLMQLATREVLSRSSKSRE